MAKKKKGKGVHELLREYLQDPEDKDALKDLLKTAADELEKLPAEKEEKDISWITCPEALKYVRQEKQQETTRNFLAHAGKCPFCREHRREILHFNFKKISPQELAKIIKQNL